MRLLFLFILISTASFAQKKEHKLNDSVSYVILEPLQIKERDIIEKTKLELQKQFDEVLKAESYFNRGVLLGKGIDPESIKPELKYDSSKLIYTKKK